VPTSLYSYLYVTLWYNVLCVIIIIIIIIEQAVVLLTSMPFSLPDPPPPWELCTVFMADYRLSFRVITTTAIFSNVPASRQLRYWYHFHRYCHHRCGCCRFCWCWCYYRRRRNYRCLPVTLSTDTLRALFPCRLYFMIIIIL